jgi:2-polyprenyl-6-methoxyphenol hydroxylase-like FAD-dependent oxidoreductase
MNKHVVGIRMQNNGVEVQCSDATTECGSVVIGADGVYSKVRQHMQGLAARSVLQPPLNVNRPLQASYRLLYGAAEILPGIEHESSWEAHGTNMSTQLFVGWDKMWFFCYEPLGSPTRERFTYTRDDQDIFVNKWGHVYLTNKIQLADIYAARLSSGMTLMEEGMANHWSWNRIVLVGDAAVKTTTNLAFGFNGGVQGLVALMNNLHGLVSTNGDCSTTPDTKHVTQAFSNYQADAMPLLAKFLATSSESTDMSVWRTWQYWVTDRYVTGATNADWKRYHRQIGPILAKSFVLDYLEEKNLPAGKFAWANYPKVAKASL